MKRDLSRYVATLVSQNWNYLLMVNLRYYSMNELESLAVALDMQKTLADQLNEVNRLSSRDRTDYYDAHTMHFIEDKFLDKYVNATRNLSGHVNELHNILKDSEDPLLVFYMYDDHLKKVVAAADCNHCIFCSC